MSDLGPVKGMTAAEIAQQVTRILAAATLEEKVAMMSGQGFFQQFAESAGRWGAHPYRAGGGCERLGVPALHFTDGPRGVVRGNATCFPVSMARGASFDTDLERRIGEAMGIEARAQGCNLSGAVCINLLRHPAWGRAQETYGEDSYHVGLMGAALATGIQTHNVIATVKHFALNSIENARFKVDVRVDARSLREVWLPHFKRVLDAGCASVMSAYNQVNGEFCGQHRELLTDILRHEWGFDGFVHSDWVFGVKAPYGAAAGLDIENPEPINFGARLVEAVESGAMEPSVIDTACRRILTTLYRFASAEDPLESYGLDLVACPAHRALAYEAAVKSAVLLKNDGVAPLTVDTLRDVAVFGRLALSPNLGDHGSSRVSPPDVVTPMQGLSAVLGDRARLAGDEGDPVAAARAAREADAAIIVVGYTARDEGEFIPGDISLGQVDTGSDNQLMSGGDRDSLRLPPDQVELIRQIAAAQPRCIVVVVAGSAVLMGEWIDAVPVVLQSFYAGMEGGRALADLLTGAVSPSGRLPFTVAASPADYPPFDKDADSIEYGSWHGYALLEKHRIQPAFPFGYGLSYARFAYRALKVRAAADGGIDAQVSIRNDGTMVADEVAQLYVGFPGVAAERPVKLLRGFQRVTLRPGETRTLHFHVPPADLAWWCPDGRRWQVETGPHRVFIGPSSDPAGLLWADVRL